GFGGAVVLLQWNLHRILVVAFKIQNIVDVGAPKRVDALGVIADHAKVVIFFCQHIGDFILRVIGMLVLIYQDIFKALLVLFKYFLMFGKKLNRFDVQIVKIHGIIMFQSCHILPINFGCNIIQRAVYKILLIVVGVDQLVFIITDQPLYSTPTYLFGIVV